MLKQYTPTQCDDEKVFDKENPESMEEDDASDKAANDESYIQDKAETDGSDHAVEEERRIQMTRWVYF